MRTGIHLSTWPRARSAVERMKAGMAPKLRIPALAGSSGSTLTYLTLTTFYSGYEAISDPVQPQP